MKINFDYLYHEIRRQTGMSVSQFSKQKLHRNEAYLSQAKQGRTTLSKEFMENLEKILDLNPDALYEKTELVEEEPFNITDLESDFEKTVRKALEEISTKIELVLELETKINKLSQNVEELLARIPKENPADKAREILYLMMGNKNHIDYHDYAKRLADAGVSKEYARGAIKEYGASIETTGYGKHKTVYILAPNTKTVEKA